MKTDERRDYDYSVSPITSIFIGHSCEIEIELYIIELSSSSSVTFWKSTHGHSSKSHTIPFYSSTFVANSVSLYFVRSLLRTRHFLYHRERIEMYGFFYVCLRNILHFHSLAQLSSADITFHRISLVALTT